jgi:hypothetical protein
MTITFARRLFLVAGIYGVVVVTPLFFLENQISANYPPAVTHPEFYYGFAFSAFAWQIVYLMLSRDPLRFRPMLIPAIMAKVGFGISVLVLFALRRLPAEGVILPSVDLLLAALFVWAYVALGRSPSSQEG